MTKRDEGRFSGVAAITVLWVTLVAGARVSGFDLLGDRPLSYLGTRPPSALLFRGGLLVSAALFVAFHGHIRRRHPVGSGFTSAMLLGQAGQVVAALVSIAGNGVAHSVHTASALVLGASLPVLMWRFAAGQPVGPWRRASYGFFWVEVLACAVGLELSRRRIAPVAEILPAIVFHLWIVAVTIVSGWRNPGRAEAVAAASIPGRPRGRAARSPT